MLQDFDKLWNYSNPEATRKEFEKKLNQIDEKDDLNYFLQLITQIVRTYGLTMDFDKGHELLDQYKDKFEISNYLTKTRYHLERGRLFNSYGNTDDALKEFETSMKLSKEGSHHYFYVDATHMKAIAIKDTNESLQWNIKAIKYAEQTQDEDALKWLGSLYNNTGWAYHDMNKYEEALKFFEKAYDFHRERKNETATDIAYWTIGRVHRSLKNIDRALEIQLELKQKNEEKAKEIGPYVAEELGELYLMQDDNRSRQFFAIAYNHLKDDPWLIKNEPERIQRLKLLSNDK